MFTAGFSLPEMAALNVLRSGLFAMAAEATELAHAGERAGAGGHLLLVGVAAGALRVGQLGDRAPGVESVVAGSVGAAGSA